MLDVVCRRGGWIFHDAIGSTGSVGGFGGFSSASTRHGFVFLFLFAAWLLLFVGCCSTSTVRLFLLCDKKK